jgi:C1A family cysteine protease
MTDTSKRIYNLNISRIPHSELKFKIIQKIDILPISFDLRPKMPPVYDQGQLGSCTANSVGACYEFNNNNAWIPSRLFIYYNERSIEGDISEDAGAMISDGIKSLTTYGVCPETLWPYNISQFAVKPPASCYTNALNHKAVTVSNIHQDVTSMKTALASGFPMTVGITVYASFESSSVAKNGIVPMPKQGEQCLGGHAVVICGWTTITGQSYWIMRNSWGSSWGDKGYFYLPFLYLLDSNLASELWTITKEANLTPRVPTPSPVHASISSSTPVSTALPIIHESESS